MKMRKKISVLLLAIWMSMEASKHFPILIEYYYSKGIYPFIASRIHSLTSWAPISVGELSLYGLGLLITGLLSYLIYLIIYRDLTWEDYRRMGLDVAIVGLVILILFNSLWGLNYYRMPLAYHLKLDIEKHSQKDLIELCEQLAEDANALSLYIAANEKGVTQVSGGYLYVFKNAMTGYHNLGDHYPLFRYTYHTAKPVHASWMMSHSGISGVYSPFTAEANVNVDIEDVMLPSTTLHEIAHLYGIAREDEANFAAYLSAVNHPDPYFQYSGTMLALIHAMNALHKVNTDAYLEIRRSYADRVQNDMEAISYFWQQYDGPVNAFQDRVNDRYLKANGQKDGVASYGRMVDLLLELDQLTPSIHYLTKKKGTPLN